MLRKSAQENIILSRVIQGQTLNKRKEREKEGN